MVASALKERTFEDSVADRQKEAVEKVAPKIVELLATLGIRDAYGYHLEVEGVQFEHNELLSTVVVRLGPSDMFAVNTNTKACTIFKNGSWRRTFDTIYNDKIAGKTNLKDLKARHVSRLKDNFGL